MGPSPRTQTAVRFAVGLSVAWALAAGSLGPACSATNDAPPLGESSGAGGAGSGNGGNGGDDLTVGSGGGSGGSTPVDPKTCAEAAQAKSYVGCDFWPTVTDNIVWPTFDFAVVVANAGTSPADVVVTRQGNVVGSATVAAESLATIYLPWVDELKSTQVIFGCAPTSIKTQTVRADGGAYHLTSTVPVTVYQFNAIEYAGVGGPAGKDWSSCPGSSCPGVGCFSFTNDASLLLPSTAATGTYRIFGMPRWLDDETSFEYPPYIAVTGLLDSTAVTVKLSSTASVAGGAGVASGGPGSLVTFGLNAGDVVELVGGMGADLSGSLLTANQPVQVISGIACSNVPSAADACDHLEETVFPAETLGKRYFVTVPTTHHGTPFGHVVRLYGNVDGTKLTFPGVNPGAPTSIDAGEVVDLGVVSQDFEVVGDHELGVATFPVGASLVDPNLPTNQQKGDPSQSLATAVEQYRTKYVFLAPVDYDFNYVDVVQPLTAELTMDGLPVSVAPIAISSDYGVARIQLGAGNGGAHVLTASAPAGIQVIGYGTYTSYQYPGGLNLGTIAPAPPK